jgi:hypothetical protein
MEKRLTFPIEGKKEAGYLTCIVIWYSSKKKSLPEFRIVAP